LSVYVTSLLVAMLQMAGGVSTVLPMNVPEFAWFFVTVLAGTVLFAAVQGVICGIVTVGDPDEIEWRQNNDALNFMMADTKLPHEQRMAVRNFFNKSRQLFKRRSYVSLIDNCLSPELKDDVRYCISETIFDCVHYLRACKSEAVGDGREFLEDLSMIIQRLAYSPREPITAKNHLNVLTVGMATRGKAFMQAGASFGDIILSSVALRDTTPAMTMIYCEAARIARDDMQACLADYPSAQAVVKHASIQLAINRAMVILSMHVHMRKTRQANAAAAAAMATPHPDAELKDIAPMLGIEWKEIEYDADNPKKAIGIQERSKTGLGKDADGVLAEVSSASEKTQAQILTKLVLATNARLDNLIEALGRPAGTPPITVAPGLSSFRGAPAFASRAPSAAPFALPAVSEARGASATSELSA